MRFAAFLRVCRQNFAGYPKKKKRPDYYGTQACGPIGKIVAEGKPLYPVSKEHLLTAQTRPITNYFSFLRLSWRRFVPIFFWRGWRRNLSGHGSGRIGRGSRAASSGLSRLCYGSIYGLYRRAVNRLLIGRLSRLIRRWVVGRLVGRGEPVRSAASGL